MPRKTGGNTTSRRKKTTTPAESAAVQSVPEQQVTETQSGVPEAGKAATEVRNVIPEIRVEARGNVTPISGAVKKTAAESSGKDSAAKQSSGKHLNGNLDEEIRRRAYELFLERGGVAGDPAHDWLIAEREVRARHAGTNPQSALAASQGRN